MSFVKIYGRRTYSNSWTVVGGFGVGGDSGAWVIDNTTGSVCGHVLAERGGLTYICPMELLLNDIKRTLNATSVCLPGGTDEEETVGLLGVSEASPALSGKADSGLANDVLESLSLDDSPQKTLQSRVRKVSGLNGGLQNGQIIPG